MHKPPYYGLYPPYTAVCHFRREDRGALKVLLEACEWTISSILKRAGTRMCSARRGKRTETWGSIYKSIGRLGKCRYVVLYFVSGAAAVLGGADGLIGIRSAKQS